MWNYGQPEKQPESIPKNQRSLSEVYVLDSYYEEQILLE